MNRYLAPGSPYRRKLAVHVHPTKATCPAFSVEGAETTVSVAKAVDAPKSGSVSKSKQARGSNPRGSKGQGVPKASGAVPSVRTIVKDLATWRLTQELYPVFVGPEPEQR